MKCCFCEKFAKLEMGHYKSVGDLESDTCMSSINVQNFDLEALIQGHPLNTLPKQF